LRSFKTLSSATFRAISWPRKSLKKRQEPPDIELGQAILGNQSANCQVLFFPARGMWLKMNEPNVEVV
jgi:hypothetical protein